jgi:hypothetical protein
MGVDNEAALFDAQEPENEADQFGTIKGTDPDAAGFFGGNGQSEREGIAVRDAPDLTLHDLDLPEVIEGLQIAKGDGRIVRCGHGSSPNNIRGAKAAAPAGAAYRPPGDAEAVVCGGVRTSSARRGKRKRPAASSITLTWQV